MFDKESVEGVVTLHDDDPDAIEPMLKSCYGIAEWSKREIANDSGMYF